MLAYLNPFNDLLHVETLTAPGPILRDHRHYSAIEIRRTFAFYVHELI